ncbi:hypothetical protein N4R57_04005 [Rhodobacteraceae bacterium D3-12]|nr:hypothetical protein N4R57_04005 [Rhodobacteraceae bacterium D3-12]
MLSGIKQTAADAARKAGLLTGGLLCVGVGLAFLTAAAWIYLAATLDALAAASIIGGVYAGLGLILIGVASSSGARNAQARAYREALHESEAQHAPAGEAPPLMQAFLYGMQAGTNASSVTRRPE